MANVYIEERPKGRREGQPIERYVVEDHADHVLHSAKTQKDASSGRRLAVTSRSSLAYGGKLPGAKSGLAICSTECNARSTSRVQGIYDG
jgi:hypothetical protein